MIIILDSTIDVPIASSSGRDNIMPENKEILSKVPFFSMVSTLLLEVAIGTSMVLSDIATLVYYKVSEQSKSVVTSISLVNMCKYL